MREILPLLETITKAARPLLVIAEDVSSDALALFGSEQSAWRSAAVKAPGFGDRRKALLEDLAVLTGGKLIDEEAGLTLEKATLADIGTAKSVRITKDNTAIVDGAGTPLPSKPACASCAGRPRRHAPTTTGRNSRSASQSSQGNFGYNAATEEFGDMVEMGMIDPTKVTRLALQNAVSVAGLLLTMETAVVSTTEIGSNGTSRMPEGMNAMM